MSELTKKDSRLHEEPIADSALDIYEDACQVLELCSQGRKRFSNAGAILVAKMAVTQANNKGIRSPLINVDAPAEKFIQCVAQIIGYVEAESDDADYQQAVLQTAWMMAAMLSPDLDCVGSSLSWQMRGE